MVVFTCAHCGDSVKKNQVEKHYQFSCRGRFPSLTCVDCLKDFNGDEHIAHTSCVTEEERYSAKGFVSKKPSEKGKKKQENWVNFVRTVLDNDVKLDKKVKTLLNDISGDHAIPQKKPKFINYCKSKFSKANVPIYEKAWDFLERQKAEFFNTSTSVKDNHLNGSSSLDDRKRKRIDSNKSSSDSENKSDANKNNGENVGKKKKKKQNCSFEGSQKGDQEVTETEKEPKRSNIKNKLTAQNSDGLNDVDLTINSENENDNNENMNEEECEDTKNSVCDPPEHLSKKQKKEKLKREKYLKQLLEIQSQPVDNISEDNRDNVDVSEKSKKKKKKVQNSETVDESQVSIKTVGKKKQKHQSIDDSADVTSQNEEEEDDIVSVKPGKFNWEETVVKLLEAKGELPLKRVEKKVISEYMNTGVHIESVEKVIAKFNKKILKMSRVKVKKDIVKLVPV